MEFRSLGDSIKGNKWVRDLADSLESWNAAQDAAGQADVATVQVRDPDRERSSASLNLREIPAVELSRVLDEDAEARRGQRSAGEGGSDSYEDLRYAALRLNYFLNQSGDRAGYGHRHPKDVAEKFGELFRLVYSVNDLVEEADRMLSEEILAQRVVPIHGYPPAAADGPSDLAEALRDDSATLRRMLEDSCRVLQKLQSTASGLDRAAVIALKDSTDARTLTRQAVIECSPWGHTPGRYHLRIFHPPGRLPVVVIGDLSDNPSTTITNGMERIAQAVSEEFLGSTSSDRIVWIRYYPAERFVPLNDVDLADDPTMALDFVPPLVRVVFRDRSYQELTWEPSDDEEIERLVGGPVRRWHARDYLSTRLQEEGTPHITIPGAGRGSESMNTHS